MRVVLIEDEIPALEKIERYILKYDESYSIVAKLSSISQAVNWFENNAKDYDIVFMDIQLSDGLSFDIFNQVQIKKPVIFVTAFDEYAIDAFKVNSIDYILKPITFTDISKALNKFKNLKKYLPTDIENVSKALHQKKYKNRFLVRIGNHIHSIETANTSLFFAEGRTVFLVTNDNKKFVLDYKLEDLEHILEPKDFFRVNRTYILNLNAINDVIMYSNSRLKIVVNANADKDIIVSRERVSTFKNWFEGN
ncbi:putative two-component response regulator autolysis regulator LytR [Flavobacteriales bacterium ALC-1]|nr:putative two-component response regulator autolysis regulator LytR [Flavobacteriales bacterium ALC-1]